MDKNLKIGKKSARPLLVTLVLLIYSGLAYLIYGLTMTNWFSNATIPTVALVLVCIGLGVWYGLMPFTRYVFTTTNNSRE